MFDLLLEIPVKESAAVGEDEGGIEAIVCYMAEGGLTLPFADQFGVDCVEQDLFEPFRLVHEVLLQHGIATQHVVLSLQGLTVFHLSQFSP